MTEKCLLKWSWRTTQKFQNVFKNEVAKLRNKTPNVCQTDLNFISVRDQKNNSKMIPKMFEKCLPNGSEFYICKGSKKQFKNEVQTDLNFCRGSKKNNSKMKLKKDV